MLRDEVIVQKSEIYFQQCRNSLSAVMQFTFSIFLTISIAQPLAYSGPLVTGFQGEIPPSTFQESPGVSTPSPLGLGGLKGSVLGESLVWGIVPPHARTTSVAAPSRRFF